MEKKDIPVTVNTRVPVAQFAFRHRQPVQIRFNDIDMLGHLNNGVYLSFMDLGKASYFNEVMPGGVDWKRINVVVVNINCDFFAPTYFHEPIEVLTAVVSISEKSFKMEQRVVNSKTGEVKCIGHTVMAGFDLSTKQSVPIDMAWVEALTAYEQRQLKA